MSNKAKNSSSRVKIAFLIPKLHGGGAERAMSYVANALAEDHSVTIITLEQPAPNEDYYLSSNIRIFHADCYCGRNITSYLKTFNQILSFKRKNRFEAVISFLPEAHFFNIITRTSEKVYISIRNHTGLRRKYVHHDIFGPIAERFHPLADKVICVSEDVAIDEYTNFHIPADKLVVIRNGICREDILAQASQENTDNGFLEFADKHPFLFANSGRLVIQKGQWHLLRVFARLREDMPEAGLFILGDGELKNKLEEEANLLKLKNDVFFCGRKTNPFSYLKYAHVFVLSSLYEGFPNVLLEALAMRLPIVADDCPGVRELLTPARPFGEKIQGTVHGAYGLLTEALDNTWEHNSTLSAAENSLLDGMREMAHNYLLRQFYCEKSDEVLADFTIEQRKAEWLQLISTGRAPHGNFQPGHWR